MAGESAQVAVLGAGILGCCLALALAHRGVRVDLYDQAERPVTGASLHNEGKLHLGFVYANDPTQTTHGLMISGSLSFARIIHELTGAIPADYLPSRPFYYLVPRDSLLGASAVEAHFQTVDDSINDLTEQNGDRYLDMGIRRYYRSCASDEAAQWFAADHCQAAFATEERSINTEALATVLRRSVAAHELVTFHGGTRVESVTVETERGVRVGLRRREAYLERSYPSAANCLWAQRLYIDRTAGLLPEYPWLYRYKATITLRALHLKHTVPSATLIVGPYGDVVNFGDDHYYLSWYPVCKLGQTRTVEGDRLHALAADVDKEVLVKESIAAMAKYIPCLRLLPSSTQLTQVGGGVIFARGASDIDDPESLLHQRSAIGPIQHGPYLSIDTGKYCMGPLFAIQAADLILDTLQ
jgi:hypothetical protein